jgi:flagellar biogenesis protein FliO
VQVLETAHLGVKKSISMVHVPGAVLVLGVTADRISLLERIDDPDGAVTEAARPAGKAPARSFQDHLRHLTASLGSGAPDNRPGNS